jgi:uncharacterized RmlC-like cupin family protein
MSTYTRITSRIGQGINTAISAGFIANNEREDIKKTHLFDGRYENIYLTEQHIPQLTGLIAEAVEHAEDILQTKNLRAGYWFNYMPPGSKTTLHTHDDDDELLSAVYYVDTPDNSGDLIIHQPGSSDPEDMITITPEAGDFVFFKPDVPHEVSENKSSDSRLSIGINFGSPDI